ncbi:MAG: YggS family pyridoxal phosphate-dependent enzyme [Verrucomicrobiota bacterium]|nr:YggS family pyridoxal phosphate-dependent enzyme [Verrucomicrobiota bacterium]
MGDPDTNMDFENRLQGIQQRITEACQRCERNPSEITLLAVSKGHSVNSILEASELGLGHFGENKIQEAKLKVGQSPPHLKWHFIGHLQSNKSRDAVRLFHMIHGVDSMKLAQALQEQCDKQSRTARILLEVNVSGEVTKHGFTQEAIMEQLEDLNALDRLEIHGFMTMAPWTPEPEKTRPVFQGLQHLRLRCEDLMGVPFPVMSMGMSNDFEIAIEEGSTIIRIGTSLFGKRSYAASKKSTKP